MNQPEHKLWDETQPPKLNSTLNVLTILTFIGCGLQLLGTLSSFVTAKTNYDMKDETLKQFQSEDMPGFAKKMMGNPQDFVEMVTKSYENRIPILLLGLVSVGLCLFGAIQMRKLKKQGYTMYVIGQLIPFITMIAFIGMFAFNGVMAWVSIGITLIFILLYTSQRKHLVY
ncbi:MAG TPA: hypothetical protein PLE75_09670 [Ferruginibacter sp.]|nr:hypothetical protein [Chitinophagaceae bacterium]HML58971.1 hypothetical protein [Ferruginibacter sp.]HRN91755.1 hypothetical protein [Ferruginibacter sp.]HRO06941.1 hypothetical protein [Ferruginibacter sp.]HRO95736.1 hypothetical protein [Ferruginibacter sp.]